jgi:hypothetical protein
MHLCILSDVTTQFVSASQLNFLLLCVMVAKVNVALFQTLTLVAWVLRVADSSGESIHMTVVV